MLTKRQKEVVNKMVQEGKKPKAISKLLKVEYNSVVSFIHHQREKGILPKAGNVYFSLEQKNKINQLVLEGKKAMEISRTLNLEHKNVSNYLASARKRGILPKANIKIAELSKEEKKMVKDLILEGKTITHISQELMLDYAAVRKYVQGERNSARLPKKFIQIPKEQSQEIIYLIENNVSRKKISEMLNIDYTKLSNHISHLRNTGQLPRKTRKETLSNEQMIAIIRHIKQGDKLNAIADGLDIDYKRVQTFSRFCEETGVLELITDIQNTEAIRNILLKYLPPIRQDIFTQEEKESINTLIYECKSIREISEQLNLDKKKVNYYVDAMRTSGRLPLLRELKQKGVSNCKASN